MDDGLQSWLAMVLGKLSESEKAVAVLHMQSGFGIFFQHVQHIFINWENGKGYVR